MKEYLLLVSPEEAGWIQGIREERSRRRRHGGKV